MYIYALLDLNKNITNKISQCMDIEFEYKTNILDHINWVKKT